jgi:7-carboxy-7-deazaguanine synthase
VFVAETFVSLQGEGVLAGTPSFFIRSSGCNLRCEWCDTPYTSWRPEGRRVAVRELLGRAAVSACRHVVVTGGEPLLQRELRPLTEALAANGHHVTVETAGTLAPEFVCDLLSVSPKTGNSDPAGAWRQRHQATRQNLTPLARLLARHAEHQLKFVVRGEEDIPDILAMVATLGVARERVLLMPEGRDAAEVAARAGEVGRLCMREGFRYSPRLHFDLFGAGRGV